MTTTLSGPSAELRELREFLAEKERERDFLLLLPTLWHSLNARCFGGNLKRVPTFRLEDLGDEVLGRFVPGIDADEIVIHRVFLDGRGVSEAERIIAVGAVVLHEQIHGRLRETSCREIDAHGSAFVREANRLSGIMGIDGKISIEGAQQSRYWPFDADEELGGIVSRLRNTYKRAARVACDQ